MGLILSLPASIVSAGKVFLDAIGALRWVIVGLWAAIGGALVWILSRLKDTYAFIRDSTTWIAKKLGPILETIGDWMRKIVISVSYWTGLPLDKLLLHTKSWKQSINDITDSLKENGSWTGRMLFYAWTFGVLIFWLIIGFLILLAKFVQLIPLLIIHAFLFPFFYAIEYAPQETVGSISLFVTAFLAIYNILATISNAFLSLLYNPFLPIINYITATSIITITKLIGYVYTLSDGGGRGLEAHDAILEEYSHLEPSELVASSSVLLHRRLNYIDENYEVGTPEHTHHYRHLQNFLKNERIQYDQFLDIEAVHQLLIILSVLIDLANSVLIFFLDFIDALGTTISTILSAVTINSTCCTSNVNCCIGEIMYHLVPFLTAVILLVLIPVLLQVLFSSPGGFFALILLTVKLGLFLGTVATFFIGGLSGDSTVFNFLRIEALRCNAGILTDVPCSCAIDEGGIYARKPPCPAPVYSCKYDAVTGLYTETVDNGMHENVNRVKEIACRNSDSITGSGAAQAGTNTRRLETCKRTCAGDPGRKILFEKCYGETLPSLVGRCLDDGSLVSGTPITLEELETFFEAHVDETFTTAQRHQIILSLEERKEKKKREHIKKKTIKPTKKDTSQRPITFDEFSKIFNNIQYPRPTKDKVVDCSNLPEDDGSEVVKAFLNACETANRQRLAQTYVNKDEQAKLIQEVPFFGHKLVDTSPTEPGTVRHLLEAYKQHHHAIIHHHAKDEEQTQERYLGSLQALHRNLWDAHDNFRRDNQDEYVLQPREFLSAAKSDSFHVLNHTLVQIVSLFSASEQKNYERLQRRLDRVLTTVDNRHVYNNGKDRSPPNSLIENDQFMCPDGVNYVDADKINTCPNVEVQGPLTAARTAAYGIASFDYTLDISFTFHSIIECWDDINANPEINPTSQKNIDFYMGKILPNLILGGQLYFDSDHEFGLQNEEDVARFKNLRYCIPLLRPINAWPLIDWKFNVFINEQCQIEDESATRTQCACPQYINGEQFSKSIETAWMYGIPHRVLYSLENSGVSLRFLITRLPGISILDNLWDYLWTFIFTRVPPFTFFPNLVSEANVFLSIFSVEEADGDRTFANNVACVLLHPASLALTSYIVIIFALLMQHIFVNIAQMLAFCTVMASKFILWVGTFIINNRREALKRVVQASARVRDDTMDSPGDILPRRSSRVRQRTRHQV